MAAKLTGLTQNSDTTSPNGGRGLYHLQFSLKWLLPFTSHSCLLWITCLLINYVESWMAPSALKNNTGLLFLNRKYRSQSSFLCGLGTVSVTRCISICWEHNVTDSGT